MWVAIVSLEEWAAWRTAVLQPSYEGMGDVMAVLRNVMAALGDVMAAHGDVMAALGDVMAFGKGAIMVSRRRWGTNRGENHSGAFILSKNPIKSAKPILS